MKSILTTIAFLALAVSGLAQTRNVVVGTNGSVVSPTNFWSANATNARSGLGLGTAATNPASAFQPSSATLSNLSLGNGVGITNITAGISNVTGLQSALDGKLGTNPTLAIANISNLQTTLDGKLGTNPTLQISNITALQTALDGKLSGTFPIAISNVSGLQSSLDGKLATNPTLAISNIAGLQTNLDSKLSLTGSAANLTNFPTVALASNVTGIVALASNVTGVVALVNGGTGATNATGARTALGVGASDVFVGLTNLGTGTGQGFASTPYILGSTNSTTPNNAVLALNAAGVRSVAELTLAALTNTDNAAFRTAIGLGTAATNPATAFQPSSSALTNLANNNGSSLTNIPVAGVVGALATNGNAVNLTNFPSILLRTTGSAAGLTNFPTVPLASNVTGTIAISNGGSGATTAGGARTNLGATTVGNAVFTATNAAAARTNLGLAQFKDADGDNWAELYDNGELRLVAGNTILFYESFDFGGTNAAIFRGQSRISLGLPWSGLTNTNAATFQAALFGTNTNPVLVNTNGEVVSPTNFWQVAPIVTRFVESQPVVNQTTNITAARNLHIHSLAVSTTGVTNTIALPTTNSFNGDVALVVHQGPTSSVTAVRTAGAATNLVTMNQFEEAVEFVYYNSVWQFNHNQSFIEPIFFSGTNAAANAAASRTNLGLGATWLTNTNAANFRTNIGLGETNSVTFSQVTVTNTFYPPTFTSTNGFYGAGSLRMTGSTTNTRLVYKMLGATPADRTVLNAEDNLINLSSASVARTNLGLGATWLTNTDVTNFRTAIGLGATNDVTFATLTLSSDLTFGSGDNIVLSTTNGTKIGTATNQLLGFYNQTPITQPSSTGVTTSGFTTGSVSNVHANSTFTGGIGTNAYTISDVVAHLKSLGLLAP